MDTDNGSEFLNEGLLAYCRTESITFTRGRAYKKNDQCFVEQKNGSIVRQLVGYDRFEGQLAWQQLAELYRVIRLYVNYFQPSMKLLTKKRDGAKVSKTYDTARTPYQRLLCSGHLDPPVQEHLKSSYQMLDPVDLLRQLERLQDAFWQHAQITRPRIRLTGKVEHPPTASSEVLDVAPGLNRQEESHGDALFLSLSPVIPADPQRSRRKYRRSEKPRVPHTWRTRKDPFETVWDEVKGRLQLAPELTAKAVLIELHEKYPERFFQEQLRTLQRKVKEWRRHTLVTFDLEWDDGASSQPRHQHLSDTNVKKEKRSKKERKLRKGRLVETAAAVQIDQGGLRRLLFDDLHRCLKKPPQNPLRLFHRYHKPDGKFIIDAG